MVVDQFAYVSSWAVLWNLRAVLGIEIAVAPAGPDGAVDPTGLGQVVDGHVALVLITHVPTHVGTVTDVAGVAAALAALDVSPVLAVDVSQSLGQLPVDVAAWGAQVAFAPGRKFLRAPRGTGVLYVAPALADSLTPLGIDLTATTAVGTGGFALVPGARRFDLFEHSLALRLGLGLAAEELSGRGSPRWSAPRSPDARPRWPRRWRTCPPWPWWRPSPCTASCRSPTITSTRRRCGPPWAGPASTPGRTWPTAAPSTASAGAWAPRSACRPTT